MKDGIPGGGKGIWMRIVNRVGSIVILAGGEGKRFRDEGRGFGDKALAIFQGETLLGQILKRASTISEDLIITVRGKDRVKLYTNSLRGNGTPAFRILLDEERGCRGPLNGIITGLRYASYPWAVTLPCDTPLIHPGILLHLSQSLKRLGASSAIPIWPEGRLEALIAAYNRGDILPIGELLCRMGRGRADDLFRGSPRGAYISVMGELQSIDPSLESFININYPRDLEAPPRPLLGRGPITDTMVVETGVGEEDIAPMMRSIDAILQGDLEPLEDLLSLSEGLEDRNAYFWSALLKGFLGKVVEGGEGRRLLRDAASKFLEEAHWYEGKGILFLSLHALIDAREYLLAAGLEGKASRIKGDIEGLYRVMGFDPFRRGKI